MGRAKERADPLAEVADILRGKKGVPYESAKLDRGEGSEWVEYIRGKDLIGYLKDHPENMLSFVAPVKPGRTVEDQATDFSQLLIRKKLLIKAERKFKKPKPGQKKLVKWPRNLELATDATFTKEAFYAWGYERPTSPWFYLMSALLVVFTVGCCLFPLAPHNVRIWVVYSLLGLLSLLLGIMLLRVVLYAAGWILTGGEFWLFPHLTSDNVPITEAFWPIIMFKKPEKQKLAHWIARLTALLLAGGLVFMLYAFSPGAVELRNNARKAHDSIITLLESMNQQQLHLASEAASSTGSSNGSSSGGSHKHGDAAAGGGDGVRIEL